MSTCDRRSPDERSSVSRIALIGGGLSLLLESFRVGYQERQGLPNGLLGLGLVCLVFACQCALSFGVARRSPRRWYVALATMLGPMASLIYVIAWKAVHPLMSRPFHVPVYELVLVTPKMGALAISAYLGHTLASCRRGGSSRMGADLRRVVTIGALLAVGVGGLAWLGIAIIDKVYYAAVRADIAASGGTHLSDIKDRAFLAVAILWLVGFALQCALAFWIGRRARPHWYWGLAALPPGLVTLVALTVPSVMAEGAAGGKPWFRGLADETLLPGLILLEIMALCAIAGSRRGRDGWHGRSPHPAEGKTPAAKRT